MYRKPQSPERLRFERWLDAHRPLLSTLTPAAAIAESGCAIGYETARRCLRAAGQPGLPRKAVGWAAADWSRTDVEIAEALGVNSTTVQARRQREGRPRVQARTGPRVGGTRKPRRPGRWDAVDWSLSDMEIAAAMRVTKQAVGGQRRRRGMYGGGPALTGG